MPRKVAEKERAAEMQELMGMFKANTCDCFSVFISTDGVANAEASGDAELCQTLSALPGKYWMIGFSLEVIRASLPDAVLTCAQEL